jgi:hypothetical protein
MLFVVQNGSITLIYCPTEDMIADTLTKALPNGKAKHFASALGLLEGGVLCIQADREVVIDFDHNPY